MLGNAGTTPGWTGMVLEAVGCPKLGFGATGVPGGFKKPLPTGGCPALRFSGDRTGTEEPCREHGSRCKDGVTRTR